VAKADRAFVAEELERWVEAGFIRRLSDKEAADAPCVSPAFVSWVRPKPRLVIDLRQVNEQLQVIKFKYEALVEFMSAVQPLDHLISWDIKDAYHHVYIYPSDRPYLTFAISGGTYEPITMPFGLSLAPWAWTKVMRPVLAYLRKSGFVVIGYVDDHGAAAPGRRPVSKADAAQGFGFVSALYDKLGLTLHPDKGDRDGTQQLTLLGHTLDTASNQVRLPDTRLAKLRGMAAALLSSARKNRRWVRRKPLQSAAGIIVSGSLAIPEARLFARSIYDDLSGGDGKSDCKLSHQSIRDLRFWASFGSAGHGRPMWPSPPAHTLHTDASGYGWGGVADDATPARGFFTGESSSWHINVKEVAAIRYSLLALAGAFSSGDAVRIVTDSQVALHVVNALASRSPALCAELRRLHAVAQDLGVSLEAEWIPTALNVWADKLSRARNSTDWTLDRTYFDSLDSAYGPHSVDRFATWDNRQLTRYNSPVLDQGRAPVDAFKEDWSQDNNWINPPFDDIPRVLDKIYSDKATATVIVPVWTAQPWWHAALRSASEVFYLPRSAGVSPYGAGGAPGRRPHWRVCALRYIRGGRAPPPWRGHERLRRSAPAPLAPARGARQRRPCSPTSSPTPPRPRTPLNGRPSCRSARLAATPTSPQRPRSSPATSATSTSVARWPRAHCKPTSRPSTPSTPSSRWTSRPSARC